MRALKWIVLVWSALRTCFFLFDPFMLYNYGEATTIFYLIYFTLVIIAMIDDLKTEGGEKKNK